MHIVEGDIFSICPNDKTRRDWLAPPECFIHGRCIQDLMRGDQQELRDPERAQLGIPARVVFRAILRILKEDGIGMDSRKRIAESQFVPFANVMADDSKGARWGWRRHRD